MLIVKAQHRGKFVSLCLPIRKMKSGFCPRTGFVIFKIEYRDRNKRRKCYSPGKMISVIHAVPKHRLNILLAKRNVFSNILHVTVRSVDSEGKKK